MKKENIYINLQGKSKEELIGIQNILIMFNEPTYRKDFKTYYKSDSYNYLEFSDGEWLGSRTITETKQEVTIQQLKEILQPMENTKFKKGDTIIITDFGSAHSDYFTLNKPYILSKDFNKENGLCVEKDDDNHINNGWSNAFDLGIKIELHKELTLTEQLEKAKTEVKRLKKEINKINIGDWCLRTDDCIFKATKNDLNWARNHSEKITDKELINKLNELIK